LGHLHGLPIQLPFLEQIKRRNVGRVAILYLVIGYLVLEIFGVFSHLLAMPEWVGRAAVILVALGFPVALLFAWAYEVTPEGLKPTREVHPAHSVAKHTGRRLDRAIIVMLAVALTYFMADKFWWSKRATPTVAIAAGAAKPPSAPAAFAPPPHSIAVLPFVNMSGDKEQEYFSEGLTEEVLNSLARINELQVAARTSSFSFQGQHPDIVTIAHKLNVGAVLEGSVRRSAHTVRITTQLVDGVSGFHIWSQSYDRDLGDVLKLQTEIATAVAGALKVTLLTDVTARIELGGTRNPAAFDTYLRATRAFYGYQTEQDLQATIADYAESIRLDPDYALAYAGRSLALGDFARNWAKGKAVLKYRKNALADANKAVGVAPDLAEGHLALAAIFTDSLEFARAIQEYERALALAPGNARLLRDYGEFAVEMGHTEAGLSAAHRAVELDPLNPYAHSSLGSALLTARRYGEAIAALSNAKALDPKDGWVSVNLGYAYYYSGNFEGARAACEASTVDFLKEYCLALVYEKLGRRADAQSMLAKLQASWGEEGAADIAVIYAQWGDTARALDYLDKAMRQRSIDLEYVKAGVGFEPLRKEPRFQAIERALKFPD
jgi:TolB-like protein/tetratricopeptide (TPR) repeat protein